MEKLSGAQKGLTNEQKVDSKPAIKTCTVPKSTFIEPKLTKHGDATKITAGFFGTFIP